MKLVKKSEIRGVIKTPPSKSYMQRVLAISVFNKGDLYIENPTLCDDALKAIDLVTDLGVKIKKTGNSVFVKSNTGSKEKVLDCGESGLCMRMFTPIAATFNKYFIIKGEGSLLRRPVGMLEEPLKNLGAFFKTKKGFPPVEVKGPIKGGNIVLDCSISSQPLTGFLISLPVINSDTNLLVKNLKSSSYIQITLDVLDKFGVNINYDNNFKKFSIPGNQTYKKEKYKIEGDWSGAAFLLIAGAIGGKVKIADIKYPSSQPDSEIIEILKQVGAKVKVEKESIFVERGELRPFDINIDEFPDLFPPLSSLACFCDGVSTIYGISRLKYKESSRAEVIFDILKKVGIKTDMTENRIKIRGGKIKNTVLNSYGDHRIAMANAILGLGTKKGIKIKNWKVVSKSYPAFFNDLKSIGGKIYE